MVAIFTVRHDWRLLFHWIIFYRYQQFLCVDGVWWYFQSLTLVICSVRKGSISFFKRQFFPKSRKRDDLRSMNSLIISHSSGTPENGAMYAVKTEPKLFPFYHLMVVSGRVTLSKYLAPASFSCPYRNPPREEKRLPRSVRKDTVAYIVFVRLPLQYNHLIERFVIRVQVVSFLRVIFIVVILGSICQIIYCVVIFDIISSGVRCKPVLRRRSVLPLRGRPGREIRTRINAKE